MNPADLHVALVARLNTQPSVTVVDLAEDTTTSAPGVVVYDGGVPTTPPADSEGRVYPYVVVWANPGGLTQDQDSLDGSDKHLLWSPQITVAAGQPLWLLRALHVVRNLLDGWRPVPGCTLREMEGTPLAMADETATPRRWYVPITYRTLVG